MRAVGSPQYLAEMAGDGALSRQISRGAQVIENTLAILSPLTFDAVVARVACAPRVRVEREGAVTRDARGVRNSRFMADCARQTPMRLRGDVDMPIPPGQTLAEGVAGPAPGDMVPIIGLRRRPAGVAEFARAVAASGADAAPVADRSARVSPAQARRTIFCAGGGAPAARHPCRRDGGSCARAQDDASARAGWAAPFAADRDVARHAGAAGTTVFRP